MVSIHRIAWLDPFLVWASLLKVATAVKGEAAEKVGYSQYVTSHVCYQNNSS